MNTQPRPRLTESSVVVRALRAVTGGAWRGVSKAVATAKQTNERMAVGLQRKPGAPPATAEQLEALLKDSRTIRALIAIASLPVTAWQHARAKQLLDSVGAIELTARIRLAGYALMAAVITHTVVLAAIGVHTMTLGWVTRAVAAVVALALMASPGAFAAAWKDRASR